MKVVIARGAGRALCTGFDLAAVRGAVIADRLDSAGEWLAPSAAFLH